MDRRLLARVCITDRTLCAEGDVLTAVVRATKERGATLVIVRELDLPAHEQAALARRVRAASGVPVLLARDPFAAAAAGVDGVHLGWTSPSTLDARARLGPDRIVGRSVHDVDEGLAAARDGVDFLLFGPVRATPKRTGGRAPLGLEPLRALAAAGAVPVVAVGGLGVDDEEEIISAGAAGFAAIRYFMSG